MINVLNRRTLAALAAAALLTLTAACGGGDSNATAAGGGDSGAGSATSADTKDRSDRDAICAEAMKAFTDFTGAVSKSASDLDAFNKVTEDLSTKLQQLADRADGELKSTLSALSGTMGTLKIDPNNPLAAADKLSDFSQQAMAQSTKLSQACS